MSELKAFNMPRYAGQFTHHEVYLKEEADKVIAELKAQKAQAEDDVAFWKRKAEELMADYSAEVEEVCVEKTNVDTLEQVLKEKDKEIAELKEQYKDMDVAHTVHIAEMNAKLEEQESEIAELKEERRWRKFPDEKPKWGEEVLVVDDESKQYIVRFSHDMKWISWGKMNTCESSAVLYWMPLPSAPKEA